MLDVIKGPQPLSPTEQNRSKVAENAPPSGEPMGATGATPDVSLAISQLANARLDSMMAPESAQADESMQMNASNGGVDFGVEMASFSWPLDASEASTADGADVDSVDAWSSAEKAGNGETANGAKSSESAYIALGKSTVSATK